MSGQSKLIESFQDFIQKQIPPMPLFCIISDIDPVLLTCYCQPIDGSAGITDVRLMASVSVGFLILPKDGSIVGVSFINENTAWVSSFSGVDQIKLNGDFYGGLAKTGTIAAKLNVLEAVVNQLVAAMVLINTSASGSPGVPVTNATLGTFFAPVLPNPVVPTVQLELSNITVKHGNGT